MSKIETKPMLQKIPVVRDEDGFFHHPDITYFWLETMGGAEHCTDEQWQALCDQAGVVTKTVWLENDPIDSPAYVEYFDNEGSALCWDPSPPPGWWLLEIGDSEDGPYAVWATNADDAKDQSK